jgi:hypothetical protein
MNVSWDYDPDEFVGRSEFADPGGRSALRKGKRCFPCPTCGRPNMLTVKDEQLGYQCDICANAKEGGAS